MHASSLAGSLAGLAAVDSLEFQQGVQSLQVPEGCIMTLDEWERRIEAIEAAAPSLPRIYMLRHALALEQQDSFLAVDSLHRYFDYWEGK